ncbi:hypothetical protein [Telmatospirillum siberiense]|uniref:Uncharacterized protein n=1 Tax=Telmatospirillum siberiense TaxID=382514 RepID=A0A2N3Q0V5_9PROT|nr:hypothetical protein [Telmatospirillum siberiense]PKU26290.1 hypothetical protein CWS72_00065 [Telmatospirillum siberiense]
MAVLMMVGTMLMVLGYYLFLLPPATGQARDEPAAAGAAAVLLAHQRAAVDWCLRTACPDGAVPSSGLTLPPGYGAAAWVQSVAQGGLVTTYATGLRVDALAIARSLGDLTAGGPSAGLSTAGGTVAVRSARSGRIPVAIVFGVPAGVPVISQKVK